MLLSASFWLTSREDNEVLNFIENKYTLSALGYDQLNIFFWSRVTLFVVSYYQSSALRQPTPPYKPLQNPLH